MSSTNVLPITIAMTIPVVCSALIGEGHSVWPISSKAPMNGFSASFGIPPAPPDPLFFSSWICAPRSLGAAVSGTGGCSPSGAADSATASSDDTRRSPPLCSARLAMRSSPRPPVPPRARAARPGRAVGGLKEARACTTRDAMAVIAADIFRAAAAA